MNKEPLLQAEQHPRKKGGKAVPALCNIAGTLILLAVIISSLAVTVPRFMGYEIYNVVSASMEPEIPVGSVIYVEDARPEDISPGEVIAFSSGDSVIAHRVTANHTVEGTFTTKGDANAQGDMNDAPYEALKGRVARHYPVLGELMVLYASRTGKAYLICFAACGAMFNILASRMRERRRQQETET
ncbi:MAG: signal peptidase I [Lachnospiraceae bacterium]|nr:signal peptidase I [Lachnospiraceae bacterium]